MKWYTLRERPVKDLESGLFFFYCINQEGDHVKGFVTGYYNTKMDIGYYVFDTCMTVLNHDERITESSIICWIPLSELKATLPKE